MVVQIRRRSQEWLSSGHGQLYLLALAAVCLAVEAIYLVTVPPATGFETSIYEPYPLGFWVAFNLCTALVAVVLLTSVLTARSYYGRAVTILAANYGIFLFLPTFRGYRLHDRGTGDLLVHLGHVRGILDTGDIPSIWYPFEHTLIAMFGMFGVPLKESGILFTLILLLVFIVTVGVFIRSFTRQRFALSAGTAAALPILMATFIRGALPAIFSILLFPVLMTFLDRLRRTVDRRYLCLLCLTVLAIIFFHPVTSAFMIILVVTTAAFGHVYSRLDRHEVRVVGTNVALAAVPVLFIWYSDFDKTWYMVSEVLRALSGGSSSPTASTVDETATLTLGQVLIRLVQNYGAVFIYLLIGALVSALGVYRIVRRRSTYTGTYLPAQFGIGFVIAVLFMSLPLESMAPIRNSRYMILMGIFIAALSVLWTFFGDDRRHEVLAVALTIAIVVSAVLAAGAVYKPNKHLTTSEFAGVDHTIEHHDSSVEVYSLDMGDNTEQFVRSTQSEDVPPYAFETGDAEIPARLGYAENETANETYGNAYVVTKDFDTEFYTASYFFPRQQEAMFVYDESDKEEFRRDSTVDRLYDNGGFEGWRVNSSDSSD